MLGLDAWIVQDGNYGELHVGQRVELAVEFGTEDPLRKEERPGAPAAEPLGGAEYRIAARVVHRAGESAVLDCGILTYATSVPEDDHVTGKAYLGVDPFTYFERLHRLPGFPALIYTWRIAAIQLEGESGSRPVEETNAWEDEDGRAHYLLDCLLLDEPPKRRSVTAVY